MLPRASMMIEKNEPIMETAENAIKIPQFKKNEETTENTIKIPQVKQRLSIMDNIDLKPRRGTVMKIVESGERTPKKIAESMDKNTEKNQENFQKIEILDLFDYAFEVGKNYERYYPHNNLSKMMEKVNEGISPGVKKKARNKSSKKKLRVGVAETRKGSSHFKMRKK